MILGNPIYYKPLKKNIYSFEQLTEENSNAIKLKICFSDKECIVLAGCFKNLYMDFLFE